MIEIIVQNNFVLLLSCGQLCSPVISPNQQNDSHLLCTIVIHIIFIYNVISSWGFSSDLRSLIQLR